MHQGGYLARVVSFHQGRVAAAAAAAAAVVAAAVGQ